MNYETRHCAHCGTALQPITLAEDGGDKERLRCPACGWTHWNNPTPVLAAIVEVGGKVLLARNAAWPGKMFALITGFMEAGESPQEGIAREVKEETNLDVRSCHAGRGLRVSAHEPGHHCLPCGGRQAR
jgi:NAD+ diphosphatase